MNIARLKLMVKMLSEVEAGTWKAPSLSKVILIDHELVNYQQSKFNLSTWASKAPKIECGFTACAVGHACLDSRFNKLGLSFNNNYSAPLFDDGAEYESSWDAVNKFFEITNNTSTILFVETQYSDHLKGNALVVQVRRRIEKLLELGEIELREAKGNVERDWTDYLISKAGRIYKIKA